MPPAPYPNSASVSVTAHQIYVVWLRATPVNASAVGQQLCRSPFQPAAVAPFTESQQLLNSETVASDFSALVQQGHSSKRENHTTPRGLKPPGGIETQAYPLSPQPLNQHGKALIQTFKPKALPFNLNTHTLNLITQPLIPLIP